MREVIETLVILFVWDFVIFLVQRWGISRGWLDVQQASVQHCLISPVRWHRWLVVAWHYVRRKQVIYRLRQELTDQIKSGEFICAECGVKDQADLSDEVKEELLRMTWDKSMTPRAVLCQDCADPELMSHARKLK